MTIKLIDLSYAQAPNAVDVYKLDGAGIRGGWVKCGEGLRSKDSCYIAHAQNLLKGGLRVGAYHVIAPSSGDPKGQAFQAQAWMAGAQGDLPLMVDIERNTPLGLDAPAWVAFLREYLEALDVRYVLYANTFFRNALEAAGLKNMPWVQAEYHMILYKTPEAQGLKDKALAAVDEATLALGRNDQAGFLKAIKTKAASMLALSRLEVDFLVSGKPPVNAWGWQLGGDANGSTVPGVDGACDLTHFLGTEEEFKAFQLEGGPIAAAPSGGPLDLAKVSLLQQALATLGYDPGKTDGVLGPKTKGALQKFQADHGLVTDGILGPKTRAALLSEIQKAGK